MLKNFQKNRPIEIGHLMVAVLTLLIGIVSVAIAASSIYAITAILGVFLLSGVVMFLLSRF